MPNHRTDSEPYRRSACKTSKVWEHLDLPDNEHQVVCWLCNNNVLHTTGTLRNHIGYKHVGIKHKRTDLQLYLK